MIREPLSKPDAYVRTRVEIPRIMRRNQQELETLISEEALQFARYIRCEKENWTPRIALI